MQRYWCNNCLRCFQSERRPQHHNNKLWNQYVWGRQTLTQLARTEGRSIQYIRDHLEQIVIPQTNLTPQPTVVVADTTFWGKHYGVTVFRSPTLKRNLWWDEVKTETAPVYTYGRKILEEQGWTILGAVVDGRRGLTTVFKDVPTQLCIFHAVKQVRKYLTMYPQTDAGKELLNIVYTLKHTNKHTFTIRLERWYRKWHYWVEAQTIVIGLNRPQWTHKKTRSAYYSLKRGLPFLFTYQKYPELHIPTTTNTLEGSFSHLKNRLRIHSGLTRERRFKVISEILRGCD